MKSFSKNWTSFERTTNRVKCKNLGAIDDDQLITHILENATSGCLLILNTTKAAQALHEKLSPQTNALHLSARMCPRHVMRVLAHAKRLRKKGLPVVLVSTQLIEAGVDISFPVVYRAECGLDSFAQAVGRCNRNGELFPQKGRAFLFQPIDHPIPSGLTDISANAAITRTQILPNLGGKDLLRPEFVRAYFEHAIWQAGPRTSQWDKPHIVSGGMPCFNPNDRSRNWAKAYQFKTASETFRLRACLKTRLESGNKVKISLDFGAQSFCVFYAKRIWSDENRFLRNFFD